MSSMISVARLGWYGKNFHDSNYMIFDTIEGFRERTRQDDAKLFELPWHRCLLPLPAGVPVPRPTFTPTATVFELW